MRITLLLVACLFLQYASNAQVPSYVPTDGLIGWWPFTGNANDESGNGNDGVVNGASLATDRTGTVDAAYSFNGFGDYIACGYSNLPAGNSPRTISFWILSEDYPQNDAFDANQGFAYGAGTDGADNEVYFWRNANNEDFLRYSGYGPQNNLDVAVEYEPQVWYHIATTYDGAAASLYFNGTMVGTQSFSGWSTVLDSVLFGTYPSRLNHHHGSIDDSGIWNRALTPTEVNSLYTGSGVGVTETTNGAPHLRVFPNPSAGRFVLETSLSGTIGIQVLDIAGRQVYTGSLPTNAGNGQQLLDLTWLSSGTYLLQVRNNSTVITERLIIE